MRVRVRARSALIVIAALVLALCCRVAADAAFDSAMPVAPVRVAALSGFVPQNENAGSKSLAPIVAVDPPVVPSITVDPSPPPGFRKPEGALLAKWRAVQDQLNQDAETLARCRAAPDLCNSPEARRLLGIVDGARGRTGRALIGEINRAINLAIRPADDMARHGVPDVWTAPLATLAAGRGDCEDYALAKLLALREAGMRGDDLRLLIVQDPGARDAHAVAAVRVDGRWILLDDRRLTLMDLADTRYLTLYALQTDDTPRVAVNTAETGTGLAPVLM